MQDLFSVWWLAYPEGSKSPRHISDYRLRFRHGRHRPRSSQQVRRVSGIWCRPGEVLTWEPID